MVRLVLEVRKLRPCRFVFNFFVAWTQGLCECSAGKCPWSLLYNWLPFQVRDFTHLAVLLPKCAVNTSTLCVLFNIRLRDNLPCFKFSYWLGVDDISRLVLFRSVLDLFNLVWKRAIIEPLCLFYTAFNMMSIFEVNDSVTSSSYIYS